MITLLLFTIEYKILDAKFSDDDTDYGVNSLIASFVINLRISTGDLIKPNKKV